MEFKSEKMFSKLLVILFVMYQASGNRKDMDQCASRAIDLVVLIDGTVSMDYGPFNEQRDFVISILSRMEFGPQATQLGVIQFSDKWNTAVEMELGEHGRKADVLRNVSNIQYQQGGLTLTGLGMHLAYEQFFGGRSKARRGVDKVVLLVTDGKPVDMDLLQNVVKDLKDKAVKIITVAIGSSDNYIQRFRYIVRGIASGYAQGFKAKKDHLKRIAEDVAKEICKTIQLPHPPQNISILQQKCFQEKKDVLFALDGSRQVDTNSFNTAKLLIGRICGELDIAPSLIHVGMIQYSDALNTRIEFGLDQYTKYHQINQSLQNVFHSKGSASDLQNALSIIDKQVFNGQDGDRINAEDFLLLFLNDVTKHSDKVFEQIQQLKNKGVHVIIIGLGKLQFEVANIYEKMASHPNDVNFLGDVNKDHIAKDLTAINCRKVICENDTSEKNKKDKRESEGESACQQRSQDVLLMIDTTMDMNGYFKKSLKFFTKFVKKLRIAATKTDVGLMTFGRSKKHFNLKLGKLSFENDVNQRILKTRQSDKWASRADIASALKMVNKEIFNTSYGGHRKEASDLILIATRGKLLNRYEVQNQVRKLTKKGVRIAVLNVGFKDPAFDRLNAIRDLTFGSRDIYPMDFRRVNAISQALIDVQCGVKDKTLSPQCFLRYRKVVFMLDSSRGLSQREIPTVTTFIKDIVRKLYTNPSNIEIGFMHYSDIRTARYTLVLRKWSLREALVRIQNLRFRPGRKNFLGHAFKIVRKKFFKRHRRDDEDQIIVLLAHNQPADPEKAFRVSEKLRSQGVEIITVAIHTKKTKTLLNPQYRALASSSSSAHSFDFSKLLESSMDILLNLCELNSCPKDTTKYCTPKKQDIFMIIDSSRSIGFQTYPRLRRFVRRLLNKLDISSERTHVGILQASGYTRTQYEMKLGEFTNPKEVESVINEMVYHEGDTSYIGRGLKIAIDDNLFNSSEQVILNGFGSNNDRLDAENVLMVYTDGTFHDEQLARRQIEELKRKGVRVVIIGLGRESRKLQAKLLLENMASTRSDVYLVNLNEPALTVEQELNEVAQQVTTLQCENKYMPPVECSPESLDLFVVIDGSRSVGYENFGKVKNFLKKLADEFAIGKNNAHFGVLQYGDKKMSRIEFNLDEHLTNKEVSKAIEKMEFLDSGRTDTGHALSIVNNKIFNGTGVDRPRVPNILILFTDGLAHDIRRAYHQADELKRKNTRIVVIGAGERADEVFQEIKSMATSEKDAHKSDFDQLSGIVDDLLDVVCI